MAWGSIASSALGVGSNVVSGVGGYVTSKERASMLEEQGNLVEADYQRQADQARDRGKRVRAQQAMQYMSSGVTLTGTPLLILRETLDKSAEEAQYLIKTGKAKKEVAHKEADIKKTEGIASLVSGIMGGASSLVGSK